MLTLGDLQQDKCVSNA